MYLTTKCGWAKGLSLLILIFSLWTLPITRLLLITASHEMPSDNLRILLEKLIQTRQWLGPVMHEITLASPLTFGHLYAC